MDVLTYLNEFLAMSRSADILRAKVLPGYNAAKEVTEIMGMYSAVRTHVDHPLNDRSAVLLDIGCGSAPRGAALFATGSAWECFGIDPAVKRGAPGIARVAVAKMTAAGFIAGNQGRLKDASAVVCVNTHGHAPLE